MKLTDNSDCAHFIALGFVPHASHGWQCCPTCHSKIRGESYIPVVYNGKQYMVCCAMERAITGITFEQQMERSTHVEDRR